MPTFSIITVVFNGASHILDTMQSVINQRDIQLEYILIDGASTDGTREIILDYLKSQNITLEKQTKDSIYIEATHEQSRICFKFLSQQDKGIYDAMNKGIGYASKEWINFMNCGDKFVHSQVLQDISQQDIQSYDVLYGDTKIFFAEKKIYLHRKAHQNLHSLWKLFSGFNHQAFFFKTTLHQQYPYSTDFKLASDYNLIYSLFANHFQFKYLKMPVSIFCTGGSSDRYGFLTLYESLQIALSFNPFPQSLKVYAYYIFGVLKKSIKLYAPEPLIKIILLLLKR